jgi:CheY-like chemotaxis protein
VPTDTATPAALVRPGQPEISSLAASEGDGPGTASAAGHPAGTGLPVPCVPRVLLAEDNAVNQKVAQGYLRRLGYSVDVAEDGRQAIDAASRGEYVAILMDCQMPELDGLAATMAIRQLRGPAARTPIIGLTAYATPTDRERCLASGMDDYLAKPFRPEDLTSVLQRWAPAGDAAGRHSGRQTCSPRMESRLA